MQTGYTELKRKSTYISSYEPRNISLAMKLQIMLSNPIMMIAISFTFTGLMVLFVFGMQVDFSDYKFSDNPSVTRGNIKNVIPTNSYINDVQVIKYQYNYTTPDGKKFESESYSTGNQFTINQDVVVEYIQDEPEISRIEGTRKGAFEFWILLIISPFILIGGILLGFRINYGLKAIKLIRYGEVAYGKLIDKQPTNTKINNSTVYKLSFQFTATNGTTYTTIAKTHLPYNLEDEPEEMLVYDANNPDKAVLIDSLPKVVKKFFNGVS